MVCKEMKNKSIFLSHISQEVCVADEPQMENAMIAVERIGHYSTFDVIADDDGNFPSLIDVVKAIKAEMGWELKSCISAARMALDFAKDGVSLNLAHVIETTVYVGE